MALNAAEQIATAATVGNLTPFEEIEPNSNVPDLHSLIEGAYNLNIVDSINADYQDFLNTYYPTLLASSSSAWLQDAIDNGGTGLPTDIEDAIWNRGRDRLDEELSANVIRASDRFSRLGWVIPPGALVDQILKAEEAKTKKACEINRDIAIAQAELEQKNIQFAIDQVTQLQKAVWGASGQLIGVLIGAYQAANTRAKDVKDAAKEFYMASLDYSRLLLAVEQFEMQFGKTDKDIDLTEQKLNVDIVNEKAKRVTDAALATANSMASLASSALSGQNTMGTLLAQGDE